MERRDQLEEFVRNQLSHYEELPSDGLWRRIEGLIPMPKQGAKPRWFWGLLTAILVLGGIVVWHLYSVHQWKDKVEKQEVALEELRDELDALQLEIASQQKSSGKILVPSQQAGAKSQDLEMTSKDPVVRLSTSQQKPSSSTVFQQKTNENDKIVEVQPPSSLNTNLQNSSAEGEIEIGKPQNSWLALEPIHEKKSFIEIEDEPVDFKPLTLSPLRARRWAVGAWMEGTNFHDNPLKALWRKARRAEDSSGDTPSFYANNPSSTKTVGFFIDFDLNRRWSIRTGLGFKDQRRPLGGDFVFEYTLEDSQMNALGHSVSPYNYYDESHNISIRTIIANELSNEPNGLEPGELFEMDFEAYQQTSYVSFPLWISYRMGQGRLKYHMRTGLVWNDLIGNSSKIRYLSFSFSQLYYQGHAINDGAIQVGYLDVGLGYGLEYALSPKLGFYFDGVMYKSVTPIFDRQPFSMGMGTGLRYQF